MLDRAGGRHNIAGCGNGNGLVHSLFCHRPGAAKRRCDARGAVGSGRGLLFVAQLAAQDLGQAVGPGSRPSVREALGGLDGLFEAAPAGDAVLELRAERDAR